MGVLVHNTCASVPGADVKVIKVDNVAKDISSIAKSLALRELSKSVIEIFTLVVVGPDVQLP